MKLGFAEIIVICIVALLVFGPDKVPYYAQKLGEVLKEVRKATDGLSKEIKENIVEPLDEVAKPLKEAAEPFKEVVEPLNDLKKELDSSVRDIQKSFTEIGKTELKVETPVEENKEEKIETKVEEKKEETAEATVEETNN